MFAWFSYDLPAAWAVGTEAEVGWRWQRPRRAKASMGVALRWALRAAETAAAEPSLPEPWTEEGPFSFGLIGLVPLQFLRF